jgi:glycosyltransferase involved in cell wall biosynthesis
MRVILTVERYHPQIGGAERVVQRIAEGLASRDHHVCVITSGRRSRAELNSVILERFPISGNVVRGIHGDPRDALEAAAKFEPEVILNYAAQTWTTDSFFSVLNSPRRPAMVLAPCGFSGLGNRTYSPYFLDLKTLLPLYDAVVCHSAIYQDFVFAQSASPHNLQVIPNGADPAQLPLDRGPKPSDLVVTVGSHVRAKGHADFFHAIRSLRRTHPGVRGALVAPRRTGGQAIRGCQVSCAVRSLFHPVKLVDGTEPSQAVRAIATGDVFVFPSQIECAPLVVLEAMAAGRPWVSYRVGNVEELSGGIVVEGFGELVEETSRFLKDKEMGTRLGEAGRDAWAETHQWPRIIGKYEDLLAAVVSSKAKATPT